MKKLLFCILMAAAFLFAGSASADLISVDTGNDVYKTTTGGQTIYWYLDLNATFYKTYNEQVDVASGLSLGISGVSDNWHLATPTEIPELLGNVSRDGMTTANVQATLLADELFGLEYTTGSWYTNKFTGRYEDQAPSGYFANGFHRIGQASHVFPFSGTFTPNYGFSNAADPASQGDLAAWIASAPSAPVPIPGAVWLLGSGLIGIVGIRRKFKI